MSMQLLPDEMTPVSEDVLSSVLSSYQLRTHVFANPRFCGNWRIGDDTDGNDARFHMLAEGSCWLHLRKQSPLALSEGDLVILPRGGWHLFAADAEVPDTQMHMQTAGASTYTSLICGQFEFLAGAVNPILDALPAAMVIPASAMGARGQRIAQMMAEELSIPQLGHSVVLDKLGDALFVMSLRHHIQQNPHQCGLMAALVDPRLARALDAIHRLPEHGWTVADLAHVAAMSRTTFAETFHQMVGLAPIEYLTRWRMTRAELMLADSRQSMESIAEQLGYESVETFRRAFKRIHGRNPGAYKRFLRKIL